ncbi:LysE family transporter [uncultured Aquitalea sp.]|uniref:LysE family translocator n=1 Tax=uncultured Aquitalea sp. TaxID=540272 RepID=UPI0025CE379E|nr:LysE family transporter [uncultured Aquitalea sp.]
MNELLAVAAITWLAVISPGADFAMVTRNSLLHGRGAGLLGATGIALGVQVHVLYVMLGVGLLIAHTPWLFSAIRLLGAAYLVWVGFQTFTAKPVTGQTIGGTASLPPLSALKAGLFTNLLNPKTTLFVLSTYTQVVSAKTSPAARIGYGLFMSGSHWLWFSLVALLLSSPSLRQRLLNSQRALNRLIGTILGLLGAGLLAATLAPV